jgi:hypothetical protein
MSRTSSLGSEDGEQVVLAQWLNLRGVLWTHCPNGGRRQIGVARKLKAAGVRRGIPDVLVFSKPPKQPSASGVAIELKREKGGQVSPEQKLVLAGLQECGWICYVAHGATAAIKFFISLGY